MLNTAADKRTRALMATWLQFIALMGKSLTSITMCALLGWATTPSASFADANTDNVCKVEYIGVRISPNGTREFFSCNGNNCGIEIASFSEAEIANLNDHFANSKTAAAGLGLAVTASILGSFTLVRSAGSTFAKVTQKAFAKEKAAGWMTKQFAMISANAARLPPRFVRGIGKLAAVYSLGGFFIGLPQPNLPQGFSYIMSEIKEATDAPSGEIHLANSVGFKSCADRSATNLRLLTKLSQIPSNPHAAKIACGGKSSFAERRNCLMEAERGADQAIALKREILLPDHLRSLPVDPPRSRPHIAHPVFAEILQ